MTVSAVIPTVGGWVNVAACIEALDIDGATREVIVVNDDPASSSPPQDLVSRRDVVILSTPGRAGFGVAANVGFAAATCELVLLINDDATVEPGAVTRLVEVLVENPRTCSVAPLIVQASRPERIDSAGIALSWLRYASDRFSGSSVSVIGSAKRQIFGATGAAGLFRADAFNEVGGFREDYFMYLEDVDLAWRLTAAGWFSFLVPAAVVRHIGSATSGRGSSFKNFYLARNRWVLWRRNLGTREFIVRLPAIAVCEIVTATIQMVVDRNVGGLRGRAAGVVLAVRMSTAPPPRLPWSVAYSPGFRSTIARLHARLRTRRDVAPLAPHRASPDEP
jgi:N-acetylglucosaminyl-diphospho-decaprenol L-rhamnosyltransferase